MEYNIRLPARVKRRPGEMILNNELLMVDSYSVAPRKNQVLHFAKYFRREFNYDFVQFGGSCEFGTDFEAWLFFDSKTFYEEIPIGACCFRKREHLNTKKWFLQWIWLHPYSRSKGILKNNFQFFIERYGSFVPEPPLSKGMYSFMAKYCPETLENNFNF